MSPFSDKEESKIRFKMIHMSHMDIISRLCSLVTIMLLKEGISVPSLFRHRMASSDVLVLHSIR